MNNQNLITDIIYNVDDIIYNLPDQMGMKTFLIKINLNSHRWRSIVSTHGHNGINVGYRTPVKFR